MDRVANFIINSTNVHVTVNGHYLDQAVSIVAQRQSSHKFSYGYMDVDPRRPIKGRSLVVGTIGIHFRAVDYFFRYLENTTGNPDNSREDAIESMRARIKEFSTQAELLAYMASVNLDSEEFKLLQEAVERNATNEPAELLPHIKAKTPDVVGDDGFRSGIKRVYYHPQLRRHFVGHWIRIHYGDAVQEQIEEDITGVVFTGLAKSPFENTAGVSADPAMEYYSFIAARIDPVVSNVERTLTVDD